MLTEKIIRIFFLFPVDTSHYINLKSSHCARNIIADGTGTNGKSRASDKHCFCISVVTTRLVSS